MSGAPDSEAVGIEPKPWGLPAVAAGLALPLLIWGGTLAAQAISEIDEEDLTATEVAFNHLFAILLYVFFVGLAVALSVWRHKVPWSALGLRDFDWGRWWLPIVAAGGAHLALILYSVAIVLIWGEDAVPDQDVDVLFEHRQLLPLAAVVVVIAAPLAEEVFFRGFVFGGLIRPFGLYGAVVASGFIFSLFHVTNPDTLGLLLPFTFIGALLAWVYYYTGSIWPSVATHFLFNAVSFVILASTAGNG